MPSHRRRLAAAGPGEVLVSEATRARLGEDAPRLKRRWRFRAKGTPQDLRVYTAEPRAEPAGYSPGDVA